MTHVDAERPTAGQDHPQHRRIVDLLAIDQSGAGTFEAAPRSQVREHSFGGAIAAQALFAASRTVSAGRLPHSVHCHFLRPGDTTAGTVLQVDRIRDGRSYATRAVAAEQHGRTTFTMTAAFHEPEPGWHHQTTTLDVPDPADVPSLDDRLAGQGGAGKRWLDRLVREHPFDYRFVGPLPRVLPGMGTLPPRLRTWLRSRDELSADPILNACALLYVTDLFLLSTALMPHVPIHEAESVARASLDHTVWFHEDTRVDEWLFFDMESTWAGHGRALCNGRVFDRRGLQVATVMQEVMIRPLGDD